MALITAVDPPLSDKLWAVQRCWASCDKCGLSKFRSMPAYTKAEHGPRKPELLFVTDRFDPAVLQTREFPTGNYEGVLRTLLSSFGHIPADYWFTPATLCPTTVPDPDDWRPLELMPVPNRAQVSACRPRLHEEIRLLCPEIIVCLGKMAVEAVFPKNPPKFVPNLGEIVEPQVSGGLSPMVVPCMVTYSLSHLYRNWDMSEGGLWNTAFNHIQQASVIARHLREQRGENISD
jgi:uracil-DNA glycosylase